MSDSARPLTVAVFNASDDTVEMLKALLSSRGYVAISGEVDKVKSGEVDFIAFIEAHRPDAMIWDIAPPYDRNWRFYKLVRQLRSLEQCAMVLTTTHRQHLHELTGEAVDAIEIIGKPYDLQAIVDAVERGIDDRGRSSSRIVSHRPR
jgi:DNA-binding NtrC family response regulator